MIRNVFEERFEVTGGWGVSGGRQLAKILSGIKRSDVVIVEATYAGANIVLEMGMAYGLAHKHRTRVFLLFNIKAPSKTIRELPEFLRSLDIISYDFEVAALREARDKIYERLQVEPEPEELMSMNIRGSTLRPRTDKQGIYMCYPKERDIWKTLINGLRDEVEKANMRLYTWVGTPSGCTSLEEVIYNVSRSSKELPISCFIDTTADDSVDLVGAFALGVATALGRGVERSTEAGADHPTDISLWTESTFEWHANNELIAHILACSQAEKSKQKRRR